MPDLSFRVKAEDDTHAGLSSAHRELDTLSEKSERASESTGGLEGALTKLGVAAAGVGAVMGAKEFLGDSIGATENLAQSVSKLQRTIGGTTEDASRLKFALGEAIGAVGGNADNAQMALQRFSKGLTGLIENEDGTTTKSSQLTDQLKAMGIQATDAAGNALPMQDVLGKLADKFKDMPDGAEKTALAMQLFGRQGVDLIPFLNKGSDGIAEMEKESDKLGLTLSANTIQQTQKLAAAQRTFGEAMEGVKVQIGVALLPLLTAMAEKATQLATFIASNVVPAIKDFANWIGPQLTPSIEQAQKLIAQIVPQVVALAEQLGQRLVPVIQQVVQWLTQHKEIALALGVAIATFVAGPIAALIAAAVLIVQHWQQITQAFEDAKPTLEAIGQAFATLGAAILSEMQPVIDWFQNTFMPEFRQDADAIAQFFTQKVIPAISAVVDFIQSHWSQIVSLFQGPLEIVKAVLQGTFEQMRAIVEGAMRVISDIITAVMDVIHGDWAGAWKAISDIPAAVLDTIKTVVSSVLTEIAGVIKGVWDTVKAQAQVAWNGLWTLIQSAWGDIKQAVADGISGLEKLIKALPGEIVGWLGDLSSTLLHAGEQLIQGFIDGIGSKAKDVKGALGGIKDKLTSWKGPPEEDAVLLTPAGQLVIQGFIDGALSRVAAVRQAMGSVADQAATAFIQAAQSAMQGVISSTGALFDLQHQLANLTGGEMKAGLAEWLQAEIQTTQQIEQVQEQLTHQISDQDRQRLNDQLSTLNIQLSAQKEQAREAQTSAQDVIAADKAAQAEQKAEASATIKLSADLRSSKKEQLALELADVQGTAAQQRAAWGAAAENVLQDEKALTGNLSDLDRQQAQDVLATDQQILADRQQSAQDAIDAENRYVQAVNGADRQILSDASNLFDLQHQYQTMTTEDRQAGLGKWLAAEITTTQQIIALERQLTSDMSEEQRKRVQDQIAGLQIELDQEKLFAHEAQTNAQDLTQANQAAQKVQKDSVGGGSSGSSGGGSSGDSGPHYATYGVAGGASFIPGTLQVNSTLSPQQQQNAYWTALAILHNEGHIVGVDPFAGQGTISLAAAPGTAASSGPNWSAPIPAGSGMAPSLPTASSIPLAPSGGGSGSVGPTIVFNISAMDAGSFQTSMPNLIRQADLYLKGHGQTGLLK